MQCDFLRCKLAAGQHVAINDHYRSEGERGAPCERRLDLHLGAAPLGADPTFLVLPRWDDRRMPSQERVPAGIGCLSTVVGLVVLAGVVVLVFFVGFIALVVVAALVVVGLIVWAVDRLLLALSPKRRARREAAQRAVTWRFGGMSTGAGPFGGAVPGEVIDTTATDTSSDQIDRWPSGDDPDQIGPA